jgi:ABC-type antimicrobial peptide transport system permease subunit
VTWDGQEREIVGVLEDVRHIRPEFGPGIQVYFPMAQMLDFNTLSLAVRSSLPPEALAERVGPVLAGLDPELPTRAWWTVASTVERATSSRRFTLSIVTAFALAALLLAGLGIYGVLAQSVAERRPEIGIRMALGATRSEVMGTVLGRTAVLAGAGGLLGAALGLVSTRTVDALLYGVGPADPVALGLAVVSLAVVAGLAAAVPAWRASRVPGVRALRAE